MPNKAGIKPNHLAKNLKYLRQIYDSTNGRLEAYLGTNTYIIRQWENGENEPPLHVLVDYSMLFEITIQDIVYVDLSKMNMLEISQNYHNARMLLSEN